ncbi:MAG: hypothetical protein OXF06_13165 [Bacteroidetes bacterium]|nr:hypothetical protein [Bacteroidota bacterium]MCY4225767.1 hypothetical protein [Bacteroidota bacterium]
MKLTQLINWIIIAIVAVAVILLLDVIIGLVAGLAKTAIPLLIILFGVGFILRFIASRRT